MLINLFITKPTITLNMSIQQGNFLKNENTPYLAN